MARKKKEDHPAQKLSNSIRVVKDAIDIASQGLNGLDYRRLLEEVQADCAARIDALDDDEGAGE